MVDVAQLVRALDCGSRGRRFETDLPPFIDYKNPLCVQRGFSFILLRISSFKFIGSQFPKIGFDFSDFYKSSNPIQAP